MPSIDSRSYSFEDANQPVNQLLAIYPNVRIILCRTSTIVWKQHVDQEIDLNNILNVKFKPKGIWYQEQEQDINQDAIKAIQKLAEYSLNTKHKHFSTVVNETDGLGNIVQSAQCCSVPIQTILDKCYKTGHKAGTLFDNDTNHPSRWRYFFYLRFNDLLYDQTLMSYESPNICQMKIMWTYEDA